MFTFPPWEGGGGELFLNLMGREARLKRRSGDLSAPINSYLCPQITVIFGGCDARAALCLSPCKFHYYFPIRQAYKLKSAALELFFFVLTYYSQLWTMTLSKFLIHDRLIVHVFSEHTVYTFHYY